MSPETWRQRAACRGMDVNFSFPEKDKHDERAAKSICATCPVEFACRAAALRSDVQGIWGGTTERERARIRRQMRRRIG